LSVHRDVDELESGFTIGGVLVVFALEQDVCRR
jgi:hypothetical protein